MDVDTSKGNLLLLSIDCAPFCTIYERESFRSIANVNAKLGYGRYELIYVGYVENFIEDAQSIVNYPYILYIV